MTACDGGTSTGRATKEGKKQQQGEPATAKENKQGEPKAQPGYG
jgi:hypothetical protein